MAMILEAIDYHVAGEALRIVTGLRQIAGETMAARAQVALEALRQERALATQEPRAHADIFACFLTPPLSQGAAFGALICDGTLESPFKGTCGHGAIALAAAALEQGWITAAPGPVEITIDMPAGPVTLIVDWDGIRAGDVLYRHVPSHVIAHDLLLGGIRGDLVDAGPKVFLLDAEAAGIPPLPAAAFAAYRQIQDQAPEATRPDLVQLRWPDPQGYRSLTFFGAAGFDRSPCGTASSALAAWAAARSAHQTGAWFTNTTLLGSRFEARLGPQGQPEIRARAYLAAKTQLILQADDPLRLGLAAPLLF